MTLRHAILQCLFEVHPYLLPEETLLSDVNLRLPRLCTSSELRAELAALEKARHLVSLRDELSGNLKYKLAESGRALLAERL